MMERKIVKESEEIVLLKDQEEVDDEEEEALSLCDLPINQEKNQIKKETFGASEFVQEDFDFNSCGGNLLNGSEMCTADEVFYQGQILPLCHSISLPSDTRGQRRIQNLNLIGSISRSESMGHTNSSSRSSSIRSQRSSSSGSTSCTYSKYKPKVRNQFHSHPSPTPQVRFPKIQSNTSNSTRNKSTLWSLFRVGLVTPPEIALQDLKSRSNKDYSGSRNSTSSSSSSSNLSNDNRMRVVIGKKKKQRMFFLGSCKCSANAVESTTVPLNVRIATTSTRNNTSKEIRKTTEVVNEDEEDNTKVIKKQAMSRHRTFEWLKQLSLEGPSDET